MGNKHQKREKGDEESFAYLYDQVKQGEIKGAKNEVSKEQFQTFIRQLHKYKWNNGIPIDQIFDEFAEYLPGLTSHDISVCFKYTI